jgi:hypothetical protein
MFGADIINSLTSGTSSGIRFFVLFSAIGSYDSLRRSLAGLHQPTTLAQLAAFASQHQPWNTPFSSSLIPSLQFTQINKSKRLPLFECRYSSGCVQSTSCLPGPTSLDTILTPAASPSLHSDCFVYWRLARRRSPMCILLALSAHYELVVEPACPF